MVKGVSSFWSCVNPQQVCCCVEVSASENTGCSRYNEYKYKITICTGLSKVRSLVTTGLKRTTLLPPERRNNGEPMKSPLSVDCRKKHDMGSLLRPPGTLKFYLVIFLTIVLRLLSVWRKSWIYFQSKVLACLPAQEHGNLLNLPLSEPSERKFAEVSPIEVLKSIMKSTPSLTRLVPF